MTRSRRTFLQVAAGVAALPAALRFASAQTYPTQPVRLIVPFPAGGQIDIVARLIGQWLSEKMGQQFFIDNRPGAGGNVGTETALRAEPDGHTLFLASATNTVNATLFDKLNFDFIRDTAAIATINRIPLVLQIHPTFPATSVAEFIAYAKANPGKVNLATPTKGTGPYMAATLFKIMSGIDVVLVPYRGDAPMLTDMLGGQVLAGCSRSMTCNNISPGLHDGELPFRQRNRDCESQVCGWPLTLAAGALCERLHPERT